MNAPSPHHRHRPTSRAPRAAWAAALALAVLAPAGAPADWLVTTDGQRIETRGVWRVQGSRVLFHLPNGTLSSLPADQVDLELSQQASAGAPQPPAPAPSDRAPVLVLTDSDVPRAPLRRAGEPAAPGGGPVPGAPPEAIGGEADAEAPAGEEGAAPEAPAGPRPRLEVTEWREEPTDTGVRFLGTLENPSPEFAALARVEVALYDEAGNLLDTRTARLGTTTLAPGVSTTFDVTFEGVYAYADVFFTPNSRGLAPRRPERASPPAAAGTEGTEGTSPESSPPEDPPPAVSDDAAAGDDATAGAAQRPVPPVGPPAAV